MKIRCIMLHLALFTASIAIAQVKIGDNPQNIDAGSVLELESNSKALVITRMATGQMNNLAPLRGALIYNTDTNCVHYYDGGQWINLCDEQNTTNVSLTLEDDELVLTDSDGNEVSVTLEGVGLQTFSTDPVVNANATIFITQTGDNYNFEVSEITGENIVDGSINGFLDIQFNSIGEDQLAPNSVGQEELQDNTVADLEIDYAQVTLNDFTNDAGFITSAEILSNDPNNALTDNGGAFYDDSAIQNAILANSNLINDHIGNDNDLDIGNELITSIQVQGDNLVIDEGTNQQTVSLASFNNSGSDNQDISTNGSPGNISIDNGSTITINVEDGDTNDSNELQVANEVPVAANPTNYNQTGNHVESHLAGIDTVLGTILAGGGSDGNDFVNAGALNVESLELTGTGGAGATVDLSDFALETELAAAIAASEA
ncbi:MAG: hypothetical protein AAGB24_14805, partial [Bacteroidota bacterium]